MTRRVRWSVPLVVAVIAAACTPSPAPMLPIGSDGDELRVMTYNVLGAQADSVVYDEHAGWAGRIDQLSPDVVVVQEAQSDDVAAIRDRTVTEYVLASFVEWDCDIKPQREGVAVLVRSTIEVLAGGGMNVGGSCLNPSVKRPLAWADVELDTGPLRVYGTHLSQGGPAFDGSRDAQIRSIRERIAVDDPGDGRRWVLAGDLNTSPGEPSYDLLLGGADDPSGRARFTDSFVALQPSAADPVACPSYAASDLAGMQRLLADPQLAEVCGYTAGWPKDSNVIGCDLLSLCVSWELRRDLSVRTRIDAVVHAAGGPVTAVAGRVPNRADPDWAAPGAEWYRLSDHLPYVVDLDVRSSLPTAVR